MAVDLIFAARPEGNIKNPEYLDGLTETLMALTDQELSWISNPRDGIHTRCKFLPTPADVFELIREKRAFLEQLNPRTSLQRLRPEPNPADYETDASRRKRIVEAALGYNPNDRKPARKITPMIDNEAKKWL